MSKITIRLTPKQKILAALQKGWIIDKENGIIYNKKGRPIGSKNNNGYLRINIKINGKDYAVHNHRLIGYLKFGDIIFLKGMMIRHKDGIKINNKWDNLLIGNNSQNQLDIPEEIRLSRAIKASKASVQKYDHKAIIEDHSNGMVYSDICEKYGISSKGTVSWVINNSIIAKKLIIN